MSRDTQRGPGDRSDPTFLSLMDFEEAAIWSSIAFYLDWRQPRQEQQQSPFWTANHNGRDTEKRAGERRCQPATAAARTTAEPLMDCKSQWQRHAKESRRPKASTGDSRGKRYRRASLWIANHNSRDTQRSPCDRRRQPAERPVTLCCRRQRPYLPVAHGFRRASNLELHCLLSGLATAAARTTTESLMDCKSQGQRHAKESRPTKALTADSRGKQ